VTNEDTRNLAGVIFPLFGFLKPVSESMGEGAGGVSLATKTVTKNRRVIRFVS